MIGYYIIIILCIVAMIQIAIYSAKKEIQNETIANLVSIIILSCLPAFTVEDLN